MEGKTAIRLYFVHMSNLVKKMLRYILERNLKLDIF